MNLRIKELLDRPGLERLNDWVSIGPVQKAALEEFTELIVRDCVEIVETQRVPIQLSRSGEMAAKWAMDALRECRDKIKEHFGVEP